MCEKDCFELWFYIDFFMISHMYIAPEQGNITSDNKISKLISKYRAFVTSIVRVKFYHHIPNSKGTRGQNTCFVH